MEEHDLRPLVSLLENRNRLLAEKERELADRNEELLSQKEELTAAIEELNEKNKSLEYTLEKLKQRNQELDQVLYRASHDLRTPVTSIFGLLGILETEGLRPSQKIIHHHLLSKTRQMQTLLKSLTMLAHAAFDPLTPSIIDLSEIIITAREELKELPNYHQLEFEVKAFDKTGFVADRQMLLIIIKCILANAIQFREPDRHGRVLITCKQRNSTLHLDIHDDGEGIDPGIGKEIFQMFYRGSNRSTGAGLGLYIVKIILERLRGSVTFESNPGSTVFHIELPSL